MQVKLETSVVIRLTLTEEEALWLRTIMQNPLNPHEESINDFDMRIAFFKTMKGITKCK